MEFIDDESGFEEVISRKDKKKVQLPLPKTAHKAKDSRQKTSNSQRMDHKATKIAPTCTPVQAISSQLANIKAPSSGSGLERIPQPAVRHVLHTNAELRQAIELLINVCTSRKVTAAIGEPNDPLTLVVEQVLRAPDVQFRCKRNMQMQLSAAKLFGLIHVFTGLLKIDTFYLL